MIATDAWKPQVNGVVRTLEGLADNAKRHGAEISLLTPQQFRTVPMPGYGEIRLALPSWRIVGKTIEAARPHAIHVATEGPIGLQALLYCRSHRIPFTTCYHTRYPEYLAARLPIPLSLSYAYLRWFHNSGAATMVATHSLSQELQARGFTRIVRWTLGIDLSVFTSGHPGALQLPRPISLCVARLAVEKNVEAFLKLDLPGTKVVVGDGPARQELERAYPDAVFMGFKSGSELVDIYASSDVLVFPSRTDTYGLVLIEAMAAGLPVAAFPVSGPRDVLAGSGCGVMSEDLRMAVLAALEIPRETCKAFAKLHGLDDSTRSFIGNVRTAGLRDVD